MIRALLGAGACWLIVAPALAAPPSQEADTRRRETAQYEAEQEAARRMAEDAMQRLKDAPEGPLAYSIQLPAGGSTYAALEVVLRFPQAWAASKSHLHTDEQVRFVVASFVYHAAMYAGLNRGCMNGETLRTKEELERRLRRMLTAFPRRLALARYRWETSLPSRRCQLDVIEDIRLLYRADMRRLMDL